MTDPVTPDPARPPETPAIPAPPTHVQKGSRRAPLLIALAVLAVAGLAAALFVLSTDDKRDPDEALANAQDAIKDAKSFRFGLGMSGKFASGSDDEVTFRTTTDGEWSDGRWHIAASEDETGVSETIFDGERSYDRYGDDSVSLASTKWEVTEVGTYSRDDMLEEIRATAELAEDGSLGDVEDMATGIAVGVYLLGDGSGTQGQAAGTGIGPSPTGFLDAIKAMSEPEVVDDSRGALTLGATLTAADDVEEALGAHMPDGKVELDLDADDMPTAFRLTVSGGATSMEFELKFRDWGDAFEIEVPGDDEIDPTPWADEEALREVEGVTPLLPSVVPDGWALSAIETIVPEDFVGEEEDPDGLCVGYDLSYDELPPAGVEVDDSWYETSGYAWVGVVSEACAMGYDDTPFAPDGPAGLPSREDKYETLQVKVGAMILDTDTSLDGAELDAFLASFAAVDIETLVAKAAEEPAGWALEG